MCSFPCLASNVLSLLDPARGAHNLTSGESHQGQCLLRFKHAVWHAFLLFSSTIAFCLYTLVDRPWTLIPHFGRRSEYEMLWGRPFLLLSFIYPHGNSLGIRLTYRYTSAVSRATKLRFLARHGNTNTSSACAWTFCFARLEAALVEPQFSSPLIYKMERHGRQLLVLVCRVFSVVVVVVVYVHPNRASASPDSLTR